MSLTQWIAHNQLVTGFTLGALWMYALMKLPEWSNNIQQSFNGSIKDETRSNKRINMMIK